MSLLSDNVIPGRHGKVFGTNAKEIKDLERIENTLLSLDGIKDVVINTEIFPREFTIHTTGLVKVKAVQDAVKATGFHAIPKQVFKL